MTAMISAMDSQRIGELPSEGSQLGRSSVVPHLVHRTHDRDVFVTSVRVVGPSRFEVRAVLPPDHSFYGAAGGRYDPLLLLESMREAIFLVGHGRYEISRHTSFISQHKEFEFDPAGLGVAGDEPVEILIDVTTKDIRRRGNSVTGMRFEFTGIRDDAVVGTASYQVGFASAAVYNRLRGTHRDARPALAVATPPLPPASVGRVDEIDVLLTDAPDARGWHLRVDPAHPVIFDHVIDHVPGNALVEAGRQAAYLVTGRPDAMLVGGGMTFSHYMEFDEPCLVSGELTAESADRRTVAVVFTQHGAISAEGTFELLLPPAAGA